MEVISLKGPHRIVRFPRDDGGGDGYWYRSETGLAHKPFWPQAIFAGSTYTTLAEAERDFLETILR